MVSWFSPFHPFGPNSMLRQSIENSKKEQKEGEQDTLDNRASDDANVSGKKQNPEIPESVTCSLRGVFVSEGDLDCKVVKATPTPSIKTEKQQFPER
jgi:hypothetical protein